MINKVKRRIKNFGLIFNGLCQKRNIELFFAKSIIIDKSSKIAFGHRTRIFGSINAVNNANIQLGNNVIAHKSSLISVANGGAVIIADNCSLGQNVILNASENNRVVLGEGTTFYGNVLISGTVKIGKGVLFANNINVLSTTHCIKGKKTIRELDKEYIEEHGSLPNEPITIGNDCWIGLNAVILPGTILGEGCVVAAGAIVKGDFPDFSIVGGVPGKIIGHRDND